MAQIHRSDQCIIYTTAPASRSLSSFSFVYFSISFCMFGTFVWLVVRMHNPLCLSVHISLDILNQDKLFAIFSTKFQTRKTFLHWIMHCIGDFCALLLFDEWWCTVRTLNELSLSFLTAFSYIISLLLSLRHSFAAFFSFILALYSLCLCVSLCLPLFRFPCL